MDAKTAEYHKKRNAELVSKGLCQSCREPKSRAGILCDGCKEKSAQKARERRAFFKSMGVCSECGKRGCSCLIKGALRKKKYFQKPGVKEKLRANDNERYRTDLNYRLARALRSRLAVLMRGKLKPASAVRDLGCTLEEFKLHISKQFKPGMSWGNYGEWELDHIHPLSAVDLTKKEQFLKVCNFKNIQPLWLGENRSKGSKIMEQNSSAC